jgi:hypothetical protein
MTMQKSVILGSVGILLALMAAPSGTPTGRAQGKPEDLRPASAFDGIADPAERSRALFTEAEKVILNPRCVNCHPAGDRPRQGDESHLHLPMVVRGDADFGAAGLHCNTCHQARNNDRAHVPGHPEWRLAPIEMAWYGRSPAEVCAQIKDPERNGGRTLAEIHAHMASDSLVGWGWHPDAGRTPAPGTQARFGELVKAWIETGAECPAS